MSEQDITVYYFVPHTSKLTTLHVRPTGSISDDYKIMLTDQLVIITLKDYDNLVKTLNEKNAIIENLKHSSKVCRII